MLLGLPHRGPRTSPETTDANLDCAFVESALLFVAMKIGRACPPPGPPCQQYRTVINETDSQFEFEIMIGGHSKRGVFIVVERKLV